MVGLEVPETENSADAEPPAVWHEDPGIRPPGSRIGIFGGTFDPPHIGHLVLAEIAHHDLKLDCVLWVLTEHPPHKKSKNISAIHHRLEMLQAAIHDNPHFRISRVDIDRPGPHYAVETVDLIKKANPNEKIVYLMGSDSLKDLPAWFNPQKFIELIDELGVMVRPGSRSRLLKSSKKNGESLPGLNAKIRYLKAPRLDIASTDIRKMVLEKGPYRYYVPETVYHIIQEKQLYTRMESQLHL